MKTALQELIEWLDNSTVIQDEFDRDIIKDKATELLKKEKNQIKEAYKFGLESPSIELSEEWAEQYYNETFKQQPEVDYQKMFANCSLPNETHKLREAAENIIQKWKCKCAITSSDVRKLEKALK